MPTAPRDSEFRRVQVDRGLVGGSAAALAGWISRYDPGRWDVAPTAGDAGRLSPWQQPRCTHRAVTHTREQGSELASWRASERAAAAACTWKRAAPVHAVAGIRCSVAYRPALGTTHRAAPKEASPSRDNPEAYPIREKTAPSSPWLARSLPTLRVCGYQHANSFNRRETLIVPRQSMQRFFHKWDFEVGSCASRFLPCR